MAEDSQSTASGNLLPVVGAQPVGPSSIPPSSDLHLVGRHITITTLLPEHAPSIWSSIKDHPTIYDYLPNGPHASLDSLTDEIVTRTKSSDPIFYAILLNKATSSSETEDVASEVVGTIAYLNIYPAHRNIELGHVLFTNGLRRTAAATEAFYLLLRHAFEDLHYERMVWKCNSLNAPSRDAALRLGFVYEGHFRKHLIVKGRWRNSDWLSMLSEEWPVRRKALEMWLNESNFDEEGVQRKKLQEIRAELEME